jgi:hypothetical protein
MMGVTLAFVPSVMISGRGRSWCACWTRISTVASAAAVSFLQALSGRDAQAQGEHGNCGELEFG